eukprot:11203003-Lingulodinium_polyedra.AAC.1
MVLTVSKSLTRTKIQLLRAPHLRREHRGKIAPFLLCSVCVVRPVGKAEIAAPRKAQRAVK